MEEEGNLTDVTNQESTLIDEFRGAKLRLPTGIQSAIVHGVHLGQLG